MVSENAPKTLQAAAVYFSNPETCLAEMIKFRWPDGVVKCPTCGSEKVSFIKARRVWECATKHAKRQFSVKVGTIMEDSALGLDKWLLAMWLICNAKNGISSYELGRSIGVTQKSAWFVLHRIRLSMQDEHNGGKLGGDVEVDETYIGGKARNMHHDRKERAKAGRWHGKTVVMGLLERNTDGNNSKVRTRVVPNARRSQLMPVITENVERGSQLYTDAHGSYTSFGDNFRHDFIDHAQTYVRENVHTNGLENYWSLLKRTISGTYVAVEPFHLFRYLDEQSFRFNNRNLTDAGRFALAAASVFGKRLTFQQLTAADATC